jgi:uncharacterized protein YyaL (SSP411 family)
MSHTHTNRLINASSPYLLQHAHNPVDWHEWSDEAFEKAKRENKLVLVSIGYSACHWCHVMEHECFEQEDTAAIMNEHFVCIKVDREERPDVDQIYMDAVQLLTGRGGWPLNCFTLPDGRPVHGGTYFPKAEWERVLKSLADFYRNNTEEALQYATDLTNGIRKLDIFPEPAEDLITHAQISDILHTWKENFDLDLGGYTWAPKFPMPNNWELFLQQYYYTGDEIMHAGVHSTLTHMAEGGIYDQAGGGFTRYSTDNFWKVPHFEKMLYDNGQLMSLYALAYQQSKQPLYQRTVYHMHSFLERELSAPGGAFYSALDADSEGSEGKFYTWHQKELAALLGEDEPLFSLYYSVDAYGNWEHGQNILYKTRTDEELEKLTGKSIAAIEQIIASCNAILLKARGQRVRPGLDDKIITSWNALMIKGYADAYKVFDDPVFLQRAAACADFVTGKMWTNGRLYRICKKDKVTIPAFAEDYSLLCEALITLFEAGGNEHYLKQAYDLMQLAIDLFHDPATALFYFKSKEDTQLVARKIDTNDDVIPSANSVFGKCLYKLGFYFDRPDYHVMARQMVRTVQAKMEKFPSGYTNWMQLASWISKGFYQVIVTGSNARQTYLDIMPAYIPNAIVLCLDKPSEIPLLADKVIGEQVQVYVCNDYTCGLPVSEVEDVLRQIIR